MWVTYGNTMLSEISQTGNVTYCVIPLIRAKSLETVSGERSIIEVVSDGSRILNPVASP